MTMTGNEVRKKFLDYFQAHNHQIVRSSSLVPHDDPTLLFTNAGMVQFKRIFLGEESRGYKRATTSQKCVRAGGKHNDLENVGYTARHHTFFEMLGNFSFGDYFKEKAIDFGWDLLTNGYGLDPEKLWISIYLDDEEAHEIWNRQIGVPAEKIARFGEKDNFWAMGDTGPCGPCSEIHLDRGVHSGCGRPDCAIGCDCDRWLEIWNLVFMQYNRDATGKLNPLPKPSIDTGLGLERMTAIVQDVPTNFDTDLIHPIMQEVENLSQKAMGEAFHTDVAMKVIADHSRAAAFLIGDGILPSNEGRGYVLRRIMRRAIRYGRNIGLVEPFLHKTAKVVFDIMKPAYPELLEGSAFITNVIKNEEIRFAETLDHGLKLLEETLSEMKAKGVEKVPGDVIFKLYDTYGFPVDIVQDVVRDQKISLDMNGFESAMEQQREKSRSVATFTSADDAFKELTAKGYKSEFVGYDLTEAEAEIVRIAREGKPVSEAEEGEIVQVVTDRTPFYGEAGGQVGDTGKITGENFQLEVSDTLKDPTGLIIHKGKIVSGKMATGNTVILSVGSHDRRNTALNHTATHILHAVLKKVLGDHVKQAGSMVGPDRLRFDFTHFSQVPTETIEEIEAMVNEKIRKNIAVNTVEMNAEEAFKTGATALFEEKYGDRVRVVALSDFSKELCGGTHTGRTGNIGLFKIISESSVASGIRRIEAITGEAAVKFIQNNEHILHNASQMLKDKPEKLPNRIEKLLTSQKSLEKEMERLKAKMAGMSVGHTDDDIQIVNGIKVFTRRVNADKPSVLRDLADKFRDHIQSGIVVLGSTAGPKVFLIAVVTKDLTDRFHAGDIIKKVSALVGGGGGGRPDMAQAGGDKPENLDMALNKVVDLISQ